MNQNSYKTCLTIYTDCNVNGYNYNVITKCLLLKQMVDFMQLNKKTYFYQHYKCIIKIINNYKN